MGATYGWDGLRKDVIAGLTVAAIALPQAMAYALIAGIDPRYGLYSAIVVTAVASVFGSSAHLINGPTNAISLVVFSALAIVAADARDDATFFLALVVGVIQIVVAVLKLGDLTRYISESVILGFMAGAGLLVALSQVGNLCGLQDQGTGHQHLIHRLWLTIRYGGPLNLRTLTIGVGTMVLVFSLRKVARRYRLPRVDMLLALILAALAAALLGWTSPGVDAEPSVAVVGLVPRGLPSFHFPHIEWEWLGDLAGSALAIAFLGLLEALAIAKALAVKTRQPLNHNQQCLAEGLANLAGGFFQCLPGSGSLTRSSINFNAGAVSRWSGVVAAAAVALVVVLFAPLAHYIPKASLAGILLVTAAGLFDMPRLRYTFRSSRYDAGLVLATGLAAVFVSVEFSILIGVGLSFLLFVPRAARLKATELAVSAQRVVRDRQPTDPPCGAMVLVDLEGELFFGAVPDLERCLDDLRKKAKAGARILVLRLKRTRNPDAVCMDRLQRFLQEMQHNGVVVLLCGIQRDFDHTMKKLRFHHWLPADRIFREDDGGDSSTLEAVRRAYDLLGRDVCETCPRRGLADEDRKVLYYMI